MAIFGGLIGGKKFKAALNVLMAEYTYERLTEQQQEQVDEISKQVMRMAGHSGHEMLALCVMPEELQYGVYALAMRQLGIKPAFPGEDWWLLGNPLSKDAEDEDAQEKAYEYLKAKHGIDIYGNLEEDDKT